MSTVVDNKANLGGITDSYSDFENLESAQNTKIRVQKRIKVDLPEEITKDESVEYFLARAAVRAPRVPTSDIIDDVSEKSPEILEKWTGTVTRLDEENNLFFGNLVRSSGEEEQGEFALEELSETERNFVEEGASFVWTLMYRDIGGTRLKISQFYFRRLPPISDSEWEKARQEAKRIGAKLGIQ